jgi:hypothetical protein
MDPTAMTDPVEMEIANAYMISRVIDPHSARTSEYIGATRACVAKRAGNLGFALAPCSTLRNSKRDRVAVVYRDMPMRGAGDKIHRIAHAKSATPRDGALRKAAASIALFCAWFREKSSMYDMRHNDMHSSNVTYDIRDRTLKLIDWGRMSIGKYRSTAGAEAIAEIRAVLGARNSFDYGQELKDLVAKWKHVHDNRFPANRESKWDRPWAADLTMFLACISITLVGVWDTYSEVGVRFSFSRNTFVLSEELDGADMFSRMEAAFQSKRTNPLYLLCMCAAQAFAYRLRAGLGVMRHLEVLVASLDETEYTAVITNIERAIMLCTAPAMTQARTGGGYFGHSGQGFGSDYDDDVEEVMAFLFPTSLGQALEVRDQRRGLSEEMAWDQNESQVEDQRDEPIRDQDGTDRIDDAMVGQTQWWGYRDVESNSTVDDIDEDQVDNSEQSISGGSKSWRPWTVSVIALTSLLSLVGGA